LNDDPRPDLELATSDCAATRLVLLKFADGTFEATRWPASRFKLPGYVGLIRAQLAPLLAPQEAPAP
jgi:hypothetical protein